jgi:Ca2+-binding RTX toxin-like protein
MHQFSEKEQAMTGKKALVLGALIAAIAAAVLGLGAGPAFAAYTASVENGTLNVVGDRASEKLALRVAPGDPNTLQIDVGDDGTADFTFDRSSFTAIQVAAGGGDDQVRIDQSGGLFTDEAVAIDGGSGNDTLLGGDGADTLIGGPGNDFVDGNRGSDTALLGGGDDTFQWDPGDGSDTVEGQGGSDRLAFNGSNAGEIMEIRGEGSRVLFTRDIAGITMDLNDIETLAIRTLGGTDTVFASSTLAGTGLKNLDVDLDAFGGGGDGAPDTVVTQGTDAADDVGLSNADGELVVGGLPTQTRVSGGEPIDTVGVEGLGGDDTLTTAVGVNALPQVRFGGGEGADVLQYDGTRGDDQFAIALNNGMAAVSAPASAVVNATSTVESTVVSGLGGNDTIAGQNGLAGITSLTLDGGAGDDTVLGGDGGDTLIGGSGNDFVDGNRGNDVAFLGTGDDHFQWDPGDGSDTIEGQAGNDQLDFNGSNAGEKIELSANGSRLLLTRDIAAITQDADGIETVNVRTLGSADTVTVDSLAGTKVKAVNVDLSASLGGGDGAADTIVVNGTDARDDVSVTRLGPQVSVAGLAATTGITGSEQALDTLLVRTLDGNDDVSVAADVSDLLTPIVDLGPGE